MEEFVTACPRNCYSTCTFRVQVENDIIVRILPYAGNQATSEGPCIKGLSYIERTNSPERIIHPLIRSSSGKFEEISMKEALDIISSKLLYIRDNWGSKSILWYKGNGMSGLTNEIGYSFWKAFGGTRNNAPLKIIPYHERCREKSNQNPIQNKKEKNISGEVSLIIFTFLASISVSILVSSFIRGVFPDKWIFISLLAGTGLVSFFHLGRKLRSWRSLANLRSSPLSREIAALIIYSIVSAFAVFLNLPVLVVLSSVSGFILLLLIDSVYIYTDKSRSVILHSGQTFISALIIISFISGSVLPFVFMALIKLGLSFYNQIVKRLNNSDFTLRFLRIVFLVVPGLNLILHCSYSDNFIIIIFLSGELLDRILFYKDFNPLNIDTLINKQIKLDRDEKKRY